MDRRSFLSRMSGGALGLSLMGGALAACSTGRGPSSKPNILFIFTDDHAAHAISAYGSVINETPNIDRIAKDGMRFDNCFVANSICAPSRATILTGKHSHLNGQVDNRITFDGSQQTFPKLLRENGYTTALIGKWHLKSDPTGFDQWSVLTRRGTQGTYYNPHMKSPEGMTEYTGYTTDIITDQALDWLKNQRDPEKPFMLMYQHKAPHREWQPSPKHRTMYDDGPIPEPPTLFDDYEGRTSATETQTMMIAENLNRRDLKLEPPNYMNEEQLKAWHADYDPKNQAMEEAGLEGEDLTRWKYQRYIKDYLRCVASVDDNIGRMLDYLNESGLAENTIVIYNSDQGFFLGEHGWFDKRWMYEESMKMPLIVKWPGVVQPGSTDDHLVQNIDFAQTFLDMTGVEAPDDMQGQSIVPLLKGEETDAWRTRNEMGLYNQFYEFPAVHMAQRQYGIRTKRYKLIHYYLIDEWELFDLRRDPYELRSLYDHPMYQDVVQEMKAKLSELRDYYQVPEKDPRPIPEQWQ